MPASWNVSLRLRQHRLGLREHRLQPLREQARLVGQAEQRPERRPRQVRIAPRNIDGIASRISGTVICHGDSWILGSTCGSTCDSP